MKIKFSVLGASIAAAVALGLSVNAFADKPGGKRGASGTGYQLCTPNCPTMQGLFATINPDLASEPFKAHRKLMEKFGPTVGVGGISCVTCHSLAKPTGPQTGAPSCQTCHGVKWKTASCGGGKKGKGC